MVLKALKRDLQHLERVSEQAGVDTVKLWESYRDHAYLWRGIAVLFIPVTLLSVIGALVMFLTADTMIEVPQKRAPQYYRIEQLPDRPIVDTAKEVLNLLASYTPDRAKAQFLQVRSYLWEPALSVFDKDVLETELNTIRDTRRTQLFLIDPGLIDVDRTAEENGSIILRVPGTRQKLIGDSPVPADVVVYYVRMTTIPRNSLNEYGLVITDIKIRVMDSLLSLQDEDRRLELQKQREDRMKKKRRRGWG